MSLDVARWLRLRSISSHLNMHPAHLPLSHSVDDAPRRDFGSVLEPRIFSAQSLSTSELLRTL